MNLIGCFESYRLLSSSNGDEKRSGREGPESCQSRMEAWNERAKSLRHAVIWKRSFGNAAKEEEGFLSFCLCLFCFCVRFRRSKRRRVLLLKSVEAENVHALMCS